MPEPEQINTEAKAHLQRGIALLAQSTPASLLEAVSCFEAAIALREQLPLAADPWFRYGLIAGWLNRGDALTRLGRPEQLAEALRSFDEGLRHLRELPMTENQLFVRRLAIAWLNRGVALLAHHTPGAAAEAVANLDEALAAARTLAVRTPEEGTELPATVWVNRANALLRCDPVRAAAARHSANAALQLTAPQEKSVPWAAELGFKARHILCQAIVQLLLSANAPRHELLSEATETVDDGLGLARHWETSGSKQFREAASELFHFGCRVYQVSQPHFLTEFLLENLDPTRSTGAMADHPEMHASAWNALWRNLAELQRDGFRALNTPRFEILLGQLRDLRLTEVRLAELRRNQSGKQV